MVVDGIMEHKLACFDLEDGIPDVDGPVCAAPALTVAQPAALAPKQMEPHQTHGGGAVLGYFMFQTKIL